MDENILTCLENFDVLWQRVSPASFLPSPIPNSLTERVCDLPMLWAQSRDLACAYCRLAAQFQGSAAMLLTRQGRETECLARRLQAEHFLRLGECLCAAPEQNKPTAKLHALRRLYLDEQSFSKNLARAAEASTDPIFAHFLSGFALAAAHRAEENRKLLLRCFRI